MKQLLAGAAAIAFCPATAMAIGLDRSGSPVDILFEEGNYFELSYGRVFPDLTGTDRAQTTPPTATTPPGTLPGGQASGDIAEDYNLIGSGVKFDLSDRLSFALIADDPYGADITYQTFAGFGTEGSLLLGGTSAQLDSSSLTGLMRYKITDRISVHGGPRLVRLGEGSVTLNGVAYGPIAGYNVTFGESYDLGYAIGAAYEIPDIAARIALTYFSKTDHDLPTVENINPLGSRDTAVSTPEAVNLDFQTGINQQTLLFGSIRYAWYEDVSVIPQAFGAATGNDLVDLDDDYSITIGVGRKFSDKLSGSLSFGYERRNDDGEGVSPLAPTDGQKSVSVGLSYALTDQVTIAGGLRYVQIGDAVASSGLCEVAALGNTGCTSFNDNSATAVGLSVGYRF